MNAATLSAVRRRTDADDTLALAPFDPDARGTWRWTQPGRFASRWRLLVDGQPVAVMRGHGTFGRPITVRFASATWEMRTRFPLELTLSAAGDRAMQARFAPGWWANGRLMREGRATLLWRREGFWGMRWALRTGELLPLVHVVAQRSFLRRECVVELEDAARREPDLAPLVAMAWALVLRTHRGHAGGA